MKRLLVIMMITLMLSSSVMVKRNIYGDEVEETEEFSETAQEDTDQEEDLPEMVEEDETGEEPVESEPITEMETDPIGEFNEAELNSNPTDINEPYNLLKEFRYVLEGDVVNELILTKHIGSDPNVVIYSPMMIDGMTYEVVLTEELFKNDSVIETVMLNGSVRFPANCSKLFYNCPNLKKVDFEYLNGIDHYDTSEAYDMSWMFADCESLSYLDVSVFNTSNVENMSYMFYKCSSLPSVNVGDFDTSNVRNMNHMFNGCSSLNSIYAENFDTSKVTDMSNMFSDCSSLKTINVTNFDTSNVTDMSEMFSGCSSLINLNVFYFDTSNVTDMSGMFNGCRSLNQLNVSGFNTSKVTNMWGMFANCSSLPELKVDLFDTSNVTSMGSMFEGCSLLKVINVSGFNTSNVENMDCMFSGCSSLTSLNLSTFNTPKLTGMFQMFAGCKMLESLDFGEFNTSKVTDMEGVFIECKSLRWLDLSSFDTSSVESMMYLFYGCDELKTVQLGKRFVKWIDGRWGSNLPSGKWYHGSLAKTEKELYEQFPSHTDSWAGIWTKDPNVNASSISIRYHSNDDSGDTIEKIGFTSVYTEPATTFSRDGYVIESWNTSFDGSGEEYGFNSYIRNDTKSPMVINLYAQWEEVYKTEIKYSQLWKTGTKATFDVGTNLGAGVADAEASLGSAVLSGNLGGKMTAEIETVGSKKNITITDEYSTGLAGKISLGPKIGNEKKKIEALSFAINGSISNGMTDSYKLSLEDYNPANQIQQYQLGKYVLGCAARKTGSTALMVLFDRMGASEYGQSVSLQAEVGASAKIVSGNVGIVKGSLLTGSKKSTAAYTKSYTENVNNSVSQAFMTTSYYPDVKYLDLELNYKQKAPGSSLGLGDKITLSGGISSSAGLGDCEEFSQGVTFLGDGSVPTEIQFVEETGYTKESFFTRKDQVKQKTVIKYQGPTALKMMRKYPELQELFKEKILLCLPSAYKTLNVDTSLSDPIKATYQVDNAEAKITGFSIPLKIKAGIELGLTFDQEGVYTLSYQTSAGKIKGQTKTEFDNSNYSSYAKEGTSENDLQTLFKKAIDDLDLESFVWDFAFELGSTVITDLYKISKKMESDYSNTVAHVIDFFSGDQNAAHNSYEIFVYSVNIGDTASLQNINTADVEVLVSNAYTVGRPFYVYLTDENGQEITDYSESPLELTLKYNEEMLEEAGIDSSGEGNLYIYKYDDELCGYVCIGGKRDIEDMSITADIYEAGEYIIASDYKAPVVRNFSVSDYSAKPEIGIFFDETSFFKQISVEVDGVEYVNTNNWKEHFSNKENAIYIVPGAELSEGEHVVTIYAVDTAGNAMELPLSYTFTVDTTAPVIENHIIKYDDSSIRIRLWSNDDDLDVSSVKMTRIVGGNEITDEIQLDRLDDYFTGSFAYEGAIEDINLEINVSDIHGNSLRIENIALNRADRVSDALSDLWYRLDQMEYDFTGSPIKPFVRVYEGSQLLKEKEDYTITYKNNKDAGSGTIVIQGKGNYTNEDAITFTINRKSLNDEDIEISGLQAVKENGKLQYLKPVIKWGKKTLKANTDYIISYDDTRSDGKIAYQDAGLYSILVEGKGNYEGAVTLHYEIASEEQTLISKAKLSKIKDVQYDGLEHKPDVELAFGKEALINGRDYVLAYSEDAVNVGLVNITITGVGAYSGSRTTSFKIVGTPLSKAKISGFISNLDYDDENPVLQDVSFKFTNKDKSVTVLKGTDAISYQLLSDEDKKIYDYIYEYENNIYPGKASVSYTGVNGYTGTVKKVYTINGVPMSKTKISGLIASCAYDGGKVLQPNLVLTYQKDKNSEVKELLPEKDYSVAYSNNDKAGTATITLTGRGLYTGSVKKTFKITPYDLAEDKDGVIEVYYSERVSFSKVGAKPEVSVWFGDQIMKEGTDYTVSYSNNGSVNDGSNPKKVPTITIKGKGSFKGTSKYSFSITKQDISEVLITAPDKVASTKVNSWKSTPILLDQGKKLSAGTDYSKEVVYTYASDGSIIQPNDVLPVGTEVTVTVTGLKNYTGSVSYTYRIIKADLSKVQATVSAKAYTGKEVTLSKDDIVLKSGKEVIDPSNYMIDETSYKNNIKKGKATVVLLGCGEYGSSKTVTFVIGPKIFQWFWNLWQ